MFRPWLIAKSTAGLMTLISSSPNKPFSPAWGFKPAIAILGSSTPNRRIVWWPSRMVVSSPSVLIRSHALLSATWIVAKITFKGPATNIIAYSLVSVNSTRISVWPG